VPLGIEVVRHVLLPDGDVELVLFAANADAALLADVGGHVQGAPDGATVTWRWAAAMAPADAVAICCAVVAGPLLADASAWIDEPIDLTR
jgi:hypothetical protein